jgi:cell division protein FtsZ
MDRREFIKIVGLATAGVCIRGTVSASMVCPGESRGTLSNQISRVKVIGVGRAGCNMLDFLLKKGMKHMEPVAMSMDPGVLNGREFQGRILMGEHLPPLPGLGYDLKAAEDHTTASAQTIQDQLQGADVALVLAGMGGITGSGGAPVLAQIARDVGVWTIGILTLPYDFEGGMRMKRALVGLERFDSAADISIVIPNNAFSSCCPPTTLVKALKRSNAIVFRAAKVFADILLTPHLLAMDFVDIRRAFPRGLARIGLGVAHLEDAPDMAVRRALHSPLLKGISAEKAGSVVCNMNLCGAEKMDQIRVAFEVLQKGCPEAELITHTRIDENARTVVTLIVGNFREAPTRAMG